MDHTTCPGCAPDLAHEQHTRLHFHLADLLGHDSMGHRVSNAISRAAYARRIVEIQDISKMNREDVLHALNVGSIGRKLILDKIPHLLNPEGAEKEHVEPSEIHEYVKRVFTKAQVASYLVWLKEEGHLG